MVQLPVTLAGRTELLQDRAADGAPAGAASGSTVVAALAVLVRRALALLLVLIVAVPAVPAVVEVVLTEPTAASSVSVVVVLRVRSVAARSLLVEARAGSVRSAGRVAVRRN